MNFDGSKRRTSTQPSPLEELKSMLKLESLFWTTTNMNSLEARLIKLGFKITPSTREPNGQEIFFGPEGIELLPSGSRSVLFENSHPQADAIYAVALESERLAVDYERLQKLFGGIEKFKKATHTANGEPLWYGCPLPETITPALRGWLVMHSPRIIERYLSIGDLPQQHPNTCWGIEGIHILTSNPEGLATKWSSVIEMPVEGLHWNEMGRSEGKRIRAGDKFLDFVSPGNHTEFSKLASHENAVFMITLKIADLEGYKTYLQKKNMPLTACNTRDGFIVLPSETGGPAIRFVRASWKKFDPVPIKGRRYDHFRSLGGAYVSTLEEGF